MIDRQQLLKDLQALLPRLEQDILAYAEARPELSAHLKAEYAQAKAANRTAEHFVAWREAQITQAAVAWLLAAVFVRFLEDNQLLDEPLLSGPAGSRLQHARDRIGIYFREQPTHAEREYLFQLFEQLEQMPVLRELLDRQHNPLWQLPVSADGAKAIIDFFQQLDPATGAIRHDFTDARWDTRFLGDLYQDLSESVRKRYALLQTPEFVESFILDYSLEKAMQSFGLPGLRLIDPTCGSGHFLLSAFERLFDAWIRREPATNARALAQRALDAVHGVDINPYAIAIARFRLLIAAMKAAGSDRLSAAPDFHFNLAVGDSLIHGRRHAVEDLRGQGYQSDLLDEPIRHVLEVEDQAKLSRILNQQYHVVVGNPPYITVKDAALNQAYRAKYPTCHRQYSLGVPFTERFFDLTLSARDNQPAGYLGMITTNSFMKREFGKKLIEDYLPHKDLTHVIDTSGAYIPGHGTPTVILFGRNQKPQSERIRAVLGIRGEPSTPGDAAQGQVWQSILSLIEKPGSENAFVSVVDQERELYGKHPWSVGGGGATELKSVIESNADRKLEDLISLIGFVCMTRADDIYFSRRETLLRFGIESEYVIYNIEGDRVRDWAIDDPSATCFPYDQTLQPHLSQSSEKFLWPHRTALWLRREPNGNHFEIGLTWFEWSRFQRERFKIPLSITFAFVATHNHFVLDRGGKVFNRSAPVIKLPADASEDDHLILLGLLNSSTACFWMKQVFHNKGATSDKGVLQDDPEKFRFEFDGTKLKSFPIPELNDLQREKLLDLTKFLDEFGKLIGGFSFKDMIEQNCSGDLKKSIEKSIFEREQLRAWMVRWQEELDWLCYELYGLLSEGSGCESLIWQSHVEDMPALSGDDRAYRYLSRPDSPNDARTRARIHLIKTNKNIGLIERPEYKRRWFKSAGAYNAENLSDSMRVTDALEQWLLDHLEAQCHAPELLTCAQLADRVRHDNAFQQVAALYLGTDTFDAQALVAQLVADDQVPQMAACRYKAKALPKFRAWQETWALQRAEDAIDARTELPETDPNHLSPEAAATLKREQVGDIPLPPKYAQADFAKASYWPLRGKLDVPKERWFSLPGCEKGGDSTLVIGWAGLDHLQRAQAIASWYLDRKEQEGWSAGALQPMLVALDELIPWLQQWHNAIDPEYGERMGDYYEGFLQEELRQLEIARDALLDWRPPAATRGRRRKIAS
ncbi:BREX-2 system adenine-specific DNA-methyltransferase PglX [Thiohalocapsa marina]|uniref:site-specific DNA-methyltransferase (adenine-specific) n=1 Tax=Thiohalocapsa marina TaxID=424902 RepID=A0A5M8FKS7_9GAMM|nr:BREX-2 system adenine-specific DNA-methyltransferase PglX [Thiohalocapsa marina]KAA6183781.1 BREX-2 system adenine-specific DNA-methyltransferase PglX [Thiohalocapsa marina]